MARNYKKELISLFTRITDPSDMDAFLSAVLTASEYEDTALRLEIVKLLAQGMPQREIKEKLGVSIAKVSHGSRESQSKKSGFKKIFEVYGESGF